MEDKNRPRDKDEKRKYIPSEGMEFAIFNLQLINNAPVLPLREG